MVRLYSFDVFDTLITRTTATPAGIFSLMQRRLKADLAYVGLPVTLRENFEILRENTESFARMDSRRLHRGEVTFDEIYDILAHHASLTPEQKKTLKKLELETELNCVVPMEINIARLRALIEGGQRVILVSDMYLPAAAIRQMLSRADPLLGTLPLYVSSEVGLTKAEGSLYAWVSKQESAEPENWTHYGDNPHADLVAAQKFGITATHCHYPGLDSHEKELLSRCPDRAFAQTLVGAARNSRRIGSFDDMAHLGASLGGPMLYPYVQWALDRAQTCGITTLYFIARDGYVLKEIADIIIAGRKLNIKTRYIYGSRKAWRIPSYREGKENQALAGYFESYISPDLPHLARSLGMDFDFLTGLLPHKYQNPVRRFSDKNLAEIKKLLFSKPQFREHFNAHAQKQRELLVRYLQQEIDFNKESPAFVELRGYGITQDCLAEVLATFHPNPIITFYLTLERNNVAPPALKQMLFPAGPRYIHDFLEALTRAPHGVTLGYEDTDGKVMPILEEAEGPAIINCGYFEYLRGVKLFAEEYTRRSEPAEALCLQAFVHYFDFIRERPSLHIAKAMSRVPFAAGMTFKKLTMYAPPLSLRQALAQGLTGIKAVRHNWEAGTMVATPKYIRRVFQAATQLRLFVEKNIFDIRIKPERNIFYLKILWLRFGQAK